MSIACITKQLAEFNLKLKEASTIEERKIILERIRNRRLVFHQFLNEHILIEDSFEEVVYRFDDIEVPKFSESHKELINIYKCLMLTREERNREDALVRVKMDAERMKEFLRKTVPPYDSLPLINNSPPVPGLLYPRIYDIYKDDLDKIYKSIREAKSEEEREKVFDMLVEKSYLLREFLKRNVSEFCNL